MSRFALVLTVLAAASLGTGCAPGRDEELRDLVETIAPADKKMVGCGWEKRWGGASQVKAYYACSWLVRGTIARVGKPLVSRAIDQGFTVYCDGKKSQFEASGAHGKQALSMLVLAPGFSGAQAISAAQGSDIPRGQVLVAIAAVKLDSSAPGGDASLRCIA